MKCTINLFLKKNKQGRWRLPLAQGHYLPFLLPLRGIYYQREFSLPKRETYPFFGVVSKTVRHSPGSFLRQ